MEKFEVTLQVLLLGFSVVMFTLFVLYLLISLFNRLLSRPGKAAVAGRSGPGQMFAPVAETRLQPGVVAAITAAVYGYISEKSSSPAVIRIAVERPPSTGRWASAGRKRLLENRLELDRLRRKRVREKI